MKFTVIKGAALAGALITSFLPVSAFAATTFITEYPKYGSCENDPDPNGCIDENTFVAYGFAGWKSDQLYAQYNASYVYYSHPDCQMSGLCIIHFTVYH